VQDLSGEGELGKCFQKVEPKSGTKKRNQKVVVWTESGTKKWNQKVEPKSGCVDGKWNQKVVVGRA
jgi:hypothetical protein